MENKSPNEFVLVPFEKLSEEALLGLIDEFILREGTDYGRHEYSLAEKHAQVRKQLEKGTTVVVFDVNEQTASLVRREQLREGTALTADSENL
jgi:uncharacterized protein YheU (UPF0270 family)